MAIANNCVIKSVKLASGEKYILPSGAVLIGASHTDFTSTCDIPVLEEMKCYKLEYQMHNENNSAGPIDPSDVLKFYIYLNGVEVAYVPSGNPFVSSVPGPIFGNTEPSLILTQSFSDGVILDEDIQIGPSPGHRAQYSVTFKTIPSIAENLAFRFTGDGWDDFTEEHGSYGYYFYPVEVDCPAV